MMDHSILDKVAQQTKHFKDEAHAWQYAGAKGLTTLYLELGLAHG